MIYFVVDAWFMSRALLNNTWAQKWLVTAHYRVGISTQSTLRGAKKTFVAPQL